MISFGDISNIKFYSIALLCGGLVLSPIIYYVFGEYPLIGSYFLKNETLEILIILAASLIIGLLMLDVATWLEGGIDEKLNDTLTEKDYSSTEDNKPHYKEWYRYLLKSYNNELIIHKVISYIVFRVKFELTLFISLIVFYLELLALLVLKINVFNCCCFLFTSVIVFTICFYLYKTAKENCIGLSYLRFKLTNHQNQ